MEWENVTTYRRNLRRMPVLLKRFAAAAAAASAAHMQDEAMQNMSDMRIGLVTGRSRALYAVRASTAGSIAAYAGYLAWPRDVEFYPRYLNDGTSKMVSKPYHDMAFEASRRFFDNAMGQALAAAMRGGL